MKKQQFIITVLFVFTAVIIIASIYQAKGIGKVSVTVAPQPQKAGIVLENQELAVSQPEDYGMVVTDNGDLSINQEYWDGIISEKVKQFKSQLSEQDIKKVREKIAEDPAKTQEKLKQIEQEVKKCQAVLDKDPDNQEAREKLQNLFIIRSIGKELP